MHGRGAPQRASSRCTANWNRAVRCARAAGPRTNFGTRDSFLAPLDANQPYLDSALSRLDSLVAGLLERGISTERIVLLGVLTRSVPHAGIRRPASAALRHSNRLDGWPDRASRHAQELSGLARRYPVFLGTSDPDPHVPFERVKETEATLRRMGAAVELRRYPGMPHTINDDELDTSRKLLQRIIAPHPKGRR